ncbi:hypothetical protein EPN18_00590 [bacterium]|nr:MAG: hypothetical protein EPN18_00590 [bacterium]
MPPVDFLSRTFVLATKFIPIKPIVPPVTSATNETLLRLQNHKAVLSAWGVNELSGLGKLSLSGNIVPQPGLTKPLPVIFDGETTFQAAHQISRNTPVKNLLSIGGTAIKIKAMPYPAPVSPDPRPRFLARRSFPLNVSYWAASWISFADGTNVILKYPNKKLIIITEKLTVGNDVTFTWERPTLDVPVRNHDKPAKPPAQPISTTLAKPGPGVQGAVGASGNIGYNGDNAPDIEIWLLDMSGRPAFDLKGMDGCKGQDGQDGGDGGDGAPGKPDALDSLGWFCASGPGNGGDGGAGGQAGSGGQGGNGGNGGNFSLYAPQTVINNYTQGVYITVDGGSGGSGGIPGTPGAGGQGGQRGDNSHGCQPAHGEVRTAGSAGPIGQPASAGASGQSGVHGVITIQPVQVDDFRRELLQPAIIMLSPLMAKEGDLVSVSGKNFTHTDVIMVDGVNCAATIASDTQAAFQAPNVNGGTHNVQVRQTDGTLSNNATLYVTPALSSIQTSGRIMPGATVRLIGTGFAPGARVRVNDQDMPNVNFINSHTIEFQLIRPASITRNASGETAAVKVLLADGTASNQLACIIETYRMLVFGDSIAWGQGLEESQKFYDRVLNAVTARVGNIGVYRDVMAHSGAILGIGNTATEPALNGEVPTSFPTVAQQVASFTDSPDGVDLILIDGGINDVGVQTILNPLTQVNDLRNMTRQSCLDDMITMLTQMAVSRPGAPAIFPNARIIVTGYYQIISDQSNLLLMDALFIALGLDIASIPGAIVGGIIAEATKARIVENCATFAQTANDALRGAVDSVNAALGAAPRIFFALPPFGPQNAVFAPNPWIYGIHANLTPEDSPAVSGPRATACFAAGNRTNFEVCTRASVGHPNADGALAYANAIIPLL